MQRDRNMPNLESFIKYPMSIEITVVLSMIHMLFYGFSYSSVCLSLVMLYFQLFIIKYDDTIMNFVENNETCNKITSHFISFIINLTHIYGMIILFVINFREKVYDFYNESKEEYNKKLKTFFELTIGNPIMAPFQSWGMRNNVGEEAYSDYGQATADSDDDNHDDGGGSDGDGDDNGLECCDKCGVKDIDPEGLEDGEVNLAEVGGGYAHEGCLSNKELKEYEKSVSAGCPGEEEDEEEEEEEDDENSDSDSDDELEVKNDEPDDDPDDEPDDGQEGGDEKEEDYEVVNNTPKVHYNLRHRKKKKSWTSIFY